MKEKLAAEELERQRRFFDTTSKTYFTEKDYKQNSYGRRVMKT